MAAQDTPVMQQHRAAKRSHPDCIIFFRLGDFYEMFGEDAVVGAGLLGLTLTSRNRGKPDEIPMAGVPHHAAHGYIARLLDAGHRVALCEQMADPKLTKGIVPREVVRIVTPGTWAEEEGLEPGRANYLCALEMPEKSGQAVGLALLDLTTGELRATVVSDLAAALGEICRARPREILLGRAEADLETTLRPLVPGARWQVMPGAPDLALLSGLAMGDAEPGARGAAARAHGYALECRRGRPIPLFRVAVWNASAFVELDRAAQAHLELVDSPAQVAGSTVLSVLDTTKTAVGARLLRTRLLAPLTDVAEILARQAEVTALFSEDVLRARLRELLADCPDLERVIVRIVAGTASPRDLGHLRAGLLCAQGLKELLGQEAFRGRAADLRVPVNWDIVSEILEKLSSALVARPPLQAKDGPVFVPGFDAELDRWGDLYLRSNEATVALESRLREATGIPSLKVAHTRVFGWYVEVTKAQSAKVPSSFARKQTVAGGERFTLPELDELAAEIEAAESRFRERERELLGELLGEAIKQAARIHDVAFRIACLDVAASLAQTARDHDYVCPVVDESSHLELVDARHPVVERFLGPGEFVPNDVALDAAQDHLWLITGPNMAGKSTFLRQTALAVILAQMGAYVPARRARIGVVDRVLSRLGASDNLAGGESTFMVEMRETSHILHRASRRSLVIVDEIGRGTSTNDGLAIAWAVAEYLDQKIGCRTLFATHFHELVRLADESQGVTNHCVLAREQEGRVVFLHRVTQGAASRSYGVAVAELAGLPQIVLERARVLLADLETLSPADLAEPAGRSESRSTLGERLAHELRELDLDRLSGLEALNLLAGWKKRLTSEAPPRG